MSLQLTVKQFETVDVTHTSPHGLNTSYITGHNRYWSITKTLTGSLRILIFPMFILAYMNWSRVRMFTSP